MAAMLDGSVQVMRRLLQWVMGIRGLACLCRNHVPCLFECEAH